MSELQKYQKNDSIVCTELDDGAVLLNLDTKYYFNLNETGLRIWQLMDECNNESEIAEKMSAEYEVKKEDAMTSILRLFEELSREGLIRT
jgi:hypothetical protein